MTEPVYTYQIKTRSATRGQRRTGEARRKGEKKKEKGGREKARESRTSGEEKEETMESYAADQCLGVILVF